MVSTNSKVFEANISQSSPRPLYIPVNQGIPFASWYPWTVQVLIT